MKPFLLALCLITTLHGQAPVIPAGKETDKNLPPKGGSWSLREAKVTNPALPRVLLIGDSITNGYLEMVRKALDGKANIDAWITPTTQADKKLPEIIAAITAWQKFDVIHFNLGLHGWQAGRIPEAQFVPLTRQMVQDLKKGAPQAKLIWATITPVTVKGEPEKLNPEIQPTIEQHNAMATQVMKEEGVAINDLSALMLKHLPLAAGDMFHWQTPGREMQAKAVTEAVTAALTAAK
ncbi:MAG: SGNH/GDSL hydrolase family protein [Prosthecobacter sp.]|nr:SGNH/GDSL hydrolase family protein [Prosthecobacter sp.]